MLYETSKKFRMKVRVDCVNNREFSIGDQIIIRSRPNNIGVIIQVMPQINGERKYKVFVGENRYEECYESQIEFYEEVKEQYVDDPCIFMSMLTAKNYECYSQEAFFSINSAKIDFVPFQFRPVIRFIKSANQKMLIADEVGVGKTIETGLIIKELTQRDNISTIVIICPKSLQIKWQKEMKYKFGEQFKIINNGLELDVLLNDLEYENEWQKEYSRCIIGFELLASEKKFQKIKNLTVSLDIDLLIIDEAHHVSNPSMIQNVISFFCLDSKSIIFLSATPLQLGNQDFFNLLRLLNPSEFIDFRTFTEMIEPNKHINEAIRLVRYKPHNDWQERTLKALKNIFSSKWAKEAFKENYILKKWLERLACAEEFTDDERVSFIEGIGELHTLSNIINRTKRKDIGAFTIRDPKTVKCRFNKDQYAFYNNVMKLKKDIMSLKYDMRTVNFIISTVERLITSCLPAFVTILDEFIEKGIIDINENADELDIIPDSKIELTDEFIKKINDIKQLASILSEEDNKLIELKKIIEDTQKNNVQGKLLVFSFFRHTLYYLYEKLKEQDIRVEIITGSTPDKKRERIRERFSLNKEDKNAIDVLLSSEVGCEGLDYQFCSRLVNYDIPWNPMKIEQRIGRIDRYGQESEKIQIYNFIIEGTVEEKVFFRCFERMGIFNETIGDMEAVLGKVVSELTTSAFDVTLTDEQKHIKALQIADNEIRKIQEISKIEKISKENLISDIGIPNEGILEKRNQQVELLKFMVTTYVSYFCETATIKIDSSSELLHLRLFKDDKKKLLNEIYRIRKIYKQRLRVKKSFMDYLASNEQIIDMCFYYNRNTKGKNLQYLNFEHPLVLGALEFFKTEAQNIYTNLKVESNFIKKGKYVFGYYIWEERGYKNSVLLKSVLYSLDEKSIIYEELNNLMVSFSKAEVVSDDKKVDRNIMNILDNYIYIKQNKRRSDLSLENEEIILKKIATQDRYYTNKLEKIEKQLSVAHDERIIKMRKGEVTKIKQSWKMKIKELKNKKQSDVMVRLFASGYLEVI